MSTARGVHLLEVCAATDAVVVIYLFIYSFIHSFVDGQA